MKMYIGCSVSSFINIGKLWDFRCSFKIPGNAKTSMCGTSEEVPLFLCLYVSQGHNLLILNCINN